MGIAGALLFPFRQILKLGLLSGQAVLVLWFIFAACEIRMKPIREFGMIIHEFDPWFNYRATEYLSEHGLDKFFKWYDYESWYPLGRPIGTTIFPGMQMTAVGTHLAMQHVGEIDYTLPPKPTGYLRGVFKYMKTLGLPMIPTLPKAIKLAPMSVNDICCMMPPIFGSIASVFTGLLSYEISRSINTGVIATGIMAIIPAHLMRSVGGEFDNEAVAMAAIVCTFFLWLRSVRTPWSWPFGVLAGLSYVYMVAAWGGYIFVLNMIGMHAAILVALGRFNRGVHKAYSLFFIIGTAGAIQVPVVGWAPLRSLEQICPLLVFLGFQVLAFCDSVRRTRKMNEREFVKFRIRVVAGFLVGLAGILFLLYPTGYFGPLSSRIRGLFVKHTKTGNPLVDSVAEHQPANPSIYASYLNLPLDYAALGGLVCLWRRTNGSYFLFLYAAIAMHFSGKMSRLVLICGPITAMACASWCGFLLDQLVEPFLVLFGKKKYEFPSDHDEVVAYAAKARGGDAPKPESGKKENGKSGKDGSKAKDAKDTKAAKKAASKAGPKVELEEWEDEERPGGMGQLKRDLKDNLWKGVSHEAIESFRNVRHQGDHNFAILSMRCVASVVIVFAMHHVVGTTAKVDAFVKHCDSVAQSLSNPKVMYKVSDGRGGKKLIDDYYAGYKWVDANTPKDARVMAWWDYGYQITGIARRTSIADGNTWNHEHIATLGRTLTSPEKKAWNAIRHLADYVLVWAGGGSDDLAKSPHLARIGNSVFPDHCGDDDPKCTKYGFIDRERTPTKMMAQSLLYKLVAHNVKSGVKVNQSLFEEVHTTKHGLLRVYKVHGVDEESKAWVADPTNRICDAPGSWYCVGQYPPALKKLIAKRRNFAQVEDFNKAGAKSAYTKMIEDEKRGGGKKRQEV